MARHKDSSWKLPDQLDNYDQLHAAVLMDIRDELQSLVVLLRCPNILRMFQAIERIDRRLAQTKPLRKKKS